MQLHVVYICICVYTVHTFYHSLRIFRVKQFSVITVMNPSFIGCCCHYGIDDELEINDSD